MGHAWWQAQLRSQEGTLLPASQRSGWPGPRPGADKTGQGWRNRPGGLGDPRQARDSPGLPRGSLCGHHTQPSNSCDWETPYDAQVTATDTATMTKTGTWEGSAGTPGNVEQGAPTRPPRKASSGSPPSHVHNAKLLLRPLEKAARRQPGPSPQAGARAGQAAATQPGTIDRQKQLIAWVRRQ